MKIRSDSVEEEAHRRGFSLKRNGLPVMNVA